jgi:periplasmic divalent cation tolerance protein
MTTVGDAGEGENLARSIVDQKLAACVQILPKMTSVYFWDGKVQAEPEHLLLIKTLEERFDELSSFIEQNHSYEVPEVVAIDVEKVSNEYLKWIREVVS